MNMRTVTTDCLVIGGGLAGLIAAREAVRAGMRATLLYDGAGASPWVHGINIPVHPEDSVESFLMDTLASGQGVSDPALAEALCNDAPAMKSEIERLGLAFNREGDGYQLLRPLGASYPRVMSVGNDTGAAVLAALRVEMKGKLDERPGVRAVRLLSENGAVHGAQAFDRHTGEWLTVAASATVLACGGFCGIYPFSTNKRDSGGDGVAMAFQAGAALRDMEFIQFEPSGAVWPEALRGTSIITTMFFEGAVLRNRSGERFMLRYGPEGERVGKDVLSMRIAAEVGAGQGTAYGGVYFDATAMGREELTRLYPSYLKRYQDVGIDLAREWVELAPVPHTSLGGVCIDAHGATTVRGLFACGEVIGGLHGANRIGGSAGLETLVFGRRAGRAAAAYAAAAMGRGGEENGAPAQPAPQGEVLADGVVKVPGADISDGNGDPPVLARIRKTLGEALQNSAGVLRERAGLENALRTLGRAREALSVLTGGSAREAFRRDRLQNDLTAALLVCTAALAREDSLGCHIRSDFPIQNPKPYRVTLSQGEDRAVAVRREPLGRPSTGGCQAQ
jgi:succinate dehydrogenase/fumarate reductase flavoprotein subunit